MISRNSKNGVKGFYINLEFPIETMWQSRWLWLHGKTKRNLTDLDPLSSDEIKDLENYVNTNLSKFKFYNSPT
jgi:hypothetical protein